MLGSNVLATVELRKSYTAIARSYKCLIQKRILTVSLLSGNKRAAVATGHVLVLPVPALEQHG